MELTPEQRAVVEHGGRRVAVLGGPGTGKTTTLLARYRKVTAEAPAAGVLVVCRERGAAGRFRDAVLPGLRGGFEALPISTVHGLAFDLIARSRGPVRVLTGAEQRVLVRELLAAEEPSAWPTLGPLLHRAGFAGEVVSALSTVQDVGLADAERAGGRWAELARFAQRYLEVLDAAGQVDATGLLACGMRHAADHRSRFSHVLVDDADVLPVLGRRMLAELASETTSVTLAADAQPDGPDLLPGPAPEAATVVVLSRRYRAAPPGRLVRCGHPSIEPEAVAGELLHAHRQGVAWSQMAVLVPRLGPPARGIGRALARHGIPVVPVPALAVEEPVVQAVLDLLRWVDGDETALDHLLASPLSGLDARQVRQVRRAAAPGPAPPEGEPLLARLVQLRNRLRQRLAAGDTAADLAYEAWAGGLSELAGEGRGAGMGAVDDRALDALVALIDGLARYGERHPGASLARTMATIDEGGLAPEPWRVAASAGADGVTLTSIGGAVGQEWHTVVVTGCVEGELPRLGVRTPLFDSTALAGPGPGADERRRLALVAERRRFDLAASRATGQLLATAAPQPGVLLSRFVEAWPQAAPDLPLAPGQPPPGRAVTAGPAPVSPAHRLVLSATQLATYDDCPLRYAYQYVLRARDEPGVHASLGSVVHEVLARFLDPSASHPRTLESLLNLADTCWRDDIARYRPQLEEARRDLIAMLHAWWEQEGQEVGGPEVLAVERRFEFDVGPHRLVGTIDRIDRVGGAEGAGGGIRVVDYKTGKKEPSAGDVADDLQLAIYHLAATRDPELAALGHPQQLQLRYLRTMRVFDQPIADDHAQRTEARILATAERILAEDFAPAVDANCRTCSFHRLCPLQPEGRQARPPADELTAVAAPRSDTR